MLATTATLSNATDRHGTSLENKIVTYQGGNKKEDDTSQDENINNGIGKPSKDGQSAMFFCKLLKICVNSRQTVNGTTNDAYSLFSFQSFCY